MHVHSNREVTFGYLPVDTTGWQKGLFLLRTTKQLQLLSPCSMLAVFAIKPDKRKEYKHPVAGPALTPWLAYSAGVLLACMQVGL